MTFNEKLELIERLATLIERKATGTPDELAIRLNISKRHVHNVITELKKLGGPIEYCPRRRSYYFTQNVKFRFGFLNTRDQTHLYNTIQANHENQISDFNI